MEQGVILVTVGLTLILLVFGEISPKTFSATHAEKVSFFVLPIINGLMVILAPAVKGVVFFSNLLLRLFRTRESEFFPSLSEEEIRSVIHMGYEEGVVAKDRRRMLSNILKMSKTRVRQAMVPRTLVTVVDVNAPLSEVMEAIGKSGYSRFPVYQGTPENVIGLVHAKDVLKSWEHRERIGLKEIMRKPYFVPESAKIEGILLDLQREKIHLAMVVDEYGGFEGIITLEDILEEIVGEIRDEYDREAEQIHFLPDGSVLVEGRITISELNERLQLELSSSSESTLAGLIMASLGCIPERGEEVTVDHFKMRVEDISRHTIKKIRITGLKKPEQARQ
jgi:putative hemolysin